uniref:Uncharacterized protein n=1 Tax=Lotus japonicus TaxID=34305 RepID=I3T261_LOTJA|nr:unknown [Lotus japonicus]
MFLGDKVVTLALSIIGNNCLNLPDLAGGRPRILIPTSDLSSYQHVLRLLIPSAWCVQWITVTLITRMDFKQSIKTAVVKGSLILLRMVLFQMETPL